VACAAERVTVAAGFVVLRIISLEYELNALDLFQEIHSGCATGQTTRSVVRQVIRWGLCALVDVGIAGSKMGREETGEEDFAATSGKYRKRSQIRALLHTKMSPMKYSLGIPDPLHK
jgi:hypothetical protein